MARLVRQLVSKDHASGGWKSMPFTPEGDTIVGVEWLQTQVVVTYLVDDARPPADPEPEARRELMSAGLNLAAIRDAWSGDDVTDKTMRALCDEVERLQQERDDALAELDEFKVEFWQPLLHERQALRERVTQLETALRAVRADETLRCRDAVWEQIESALAVRAADDRDDHGACELEGCAAPYPHYHRDTLDGPEIVRGYPAVRAADDRDEP